MAKGGIHWFAPASAIGSLTTASLLAIGHHLFYRSLHDTAVSDGTFLDFQISQQQVNIAVGTTFAFLARACMVVAISVAFVQVFWFAVNSRSKEGAPTLARVDVAYTALENAFEMFNIRSWWNYPLLMLIAGLAWLVPIASIITPATLSVRTSRVSPAPVSSVQVPALDFTNMKYVAQMPNTKVPSLGSYQGPQPFYYAYAGASDEVLRIANAVIGDGSILPIKPPGVNSSWQLEFDGPSLECNDLDHTQAVGFGHDLVRLMQYAKNGEPGLQCAYVMWFPDTNSEEIQVPVGYNTSNMSAPRLVPDSKVFDLGSLVPHATDASLNQSGQALEIAVLTKSFQQDESWDPEKDVALGVRRCQLFNATYHVSFDYSGGIQRVIPSTTRNRAEGPIQHIPGVLYKYMNQLTDGYEYPCSGPEAESLRCCYTHPNLFQTLAYQAIMDSFTQSFQGLIYMDNISYPGLGGAEGTGFFVNSSLMQTRLAQSKDLQYLRTALLDEARHTGRFTFQAALETKNDTVMVNADDLTIAAPGIFNTSASLSGLDMPLGDVIEEVFRNLTVSLMSSAALQPNYTSLAAPLPVAVKHELYHNVYIYSAQKLWLPYGIALALTALAVIAGLVTMLLNKASYSSNFSTILRAAHGVQLSTKMLDEDVYGQDPLPKYLANAKVWLHSVGPSTALVDTREASPPANSPPKVMSTLRLLGRHSNSPSGSRGRI